jgi:hypothetical protein
MEQLLKSLIGSSISRGKWRSMPLLPNEDRAGGKKIIRQAVRNF